MNLESISYVLLYFTHSKTFESREIGEVDLNAQKLIKFRNGESVLVKTTFDGNETNGIIVQLADDEALIKPAISQCSKLKAKHWSLERIIKHSGVVREIFAGGPRQRFLTLEKVYTTDAETSDSDEGKLRSTPVS